MSVIIPFVTTHTPGSETFTLFSMPDALPDILTQAGFGGLYLAITPGSCLVRPDGVSVSAEHRSLDGNINVTLQFSLNTDILLTLSAEDLYCFFRGQSSTDLFRAQACVHRCAEFINLLLDIRMNKCTEYSSKLSVASFLKGFFISRGFVFADLNPNQLDANGTSVTGIIPVSFKNWNVKDSITLNFTESGNNITWGASSKVAVGGSAWANLSATRPFDKSGFVDELFKVLDRYVQLLLLSELIEACDHLGLHTGPDLWAIEATTVVVSMTHSEDPAYQMRVRLTSNIGNFELECTLDDRITPSNPAQDTWTSRPQGVKALRQALDQAVAEWWQP